MAEWISESEIAISKMFSRRQYILHVDAIHIGKMGTLHFDVRAKPLPLTDGRLARRHLARQMSKFDTKLDGNAG
jgi:hypothetical protein